MDSGSTTAKKPSGESNEKQLYKAIKEHFDKRENYKLRATELYLALTNTNLVKFK